MLLMQKEVSLWHILHERVLCFHHQDIMQKGNQKCQIVK